MRATQLNRLERVEEQIDSRYHTLLLDDGTRFRADKFSTLNVVIASCGLDCSPDDATIRALARSRPSPGDGAIDDLARRICQQVVDGTFGKEPPPSGVPVQWDEDDVVMEHPS